MKIDAGLKERPAVSGLIEYRGCYITGGISGHGPWMEDKTKIVWALAIAIAGDPKGNYWIEERSRIVVGD